MRYILTLSAIFMFVGALKTQIDLPPVVLPAPNAAELVEFDFTPNMLNANGVSLSYGYNSYGRLKYIRDGGDDIRFGTQFPSIVLRTAQYSDDPAGLIPMADYKVPEGVNDTVQPVYYDQSGRPPHRSGGNLGVLRVGPFAEQDSNSVVYFNNKEKLHYIERHESSALNWVIEHRDPGKNWGDPGNEVTTECRFNIVADDLEGTFLSPVSVSLITAFTEGELSLIITTHESSTRCIAKGLVGQFFFHNLNKSKQTFKSISKC